MVAVAASAAMASGVYPVVTTLARRRGRRMPPARVIAREWARGVVSSAARPLGLLPMPGRVGARPVILVHGYAMSRGYLWLLARRLARAGFGPIVGYEYWSLGPIGRAAEGLGQCVARVRERTGAERIGVVGHSLGGVVARHYVALDRGAGIDRVITLGSPHAGTRLVAVAGLGRIRRELVRGSELLERVGAAPIPDDVAMTVIHSREDTLCGSLANAVVPGAEIVCVDGVEHLEMVTSRKIARLVIDRL